MKLFTDIETRALPDAVEHLPTPAPPANYKDAEKIAAWLAEKKTLQLREAALDPDTGWIDAIACAPGVRGGITVIAAVSQNDLTEDEWSRIQNHVGEKSLDGSHRLSLNEITKYGVKFNVVLFTYSHDLPRVYAERGVINEWWRKYTEHNGDVCGYNIKAFDLPYLMRRTLYTNATPMPPMPNLGKYSSAITDLYAELYHYKPGKGLKTVAKLLGIPNPFAEGYGVEINGETAQTLSLFERLAYAANDVYLTQQLAEKMVNLYIHLEEPDLVEDKFPF